MPFLKGKAAHCNEDRPCRHLDPCPRCDAHTWLSADDWATVEFYGRVSDQYINQTPMGVESGPPIVTPRLEGYEAALRLYGYPRADWPGLVDGAAMLHRLCTGQDSVSWYHELGKSFSTVTPEDVDGY